MYSFLRPCLAVVFQFAHVLDSGSPNYPSCTVTVPPSVTGQDALSAVAPRWTHNKYDFALYSVGGHRISPNLSLFENGIRNGDVLGLQGGGSQPIPTGPPSWKIRVADVPYGVTLLKRDGKYRDVNLPTSTYLSPIHS